MIQQLFYLIALLIIAFGIIVIIRFTRSVTKPIEAVVSGMKQVQEGDLSVSLPEPHLFGKSLLSITALTIWFPIWII